MARPVAFWPPGLNWEDAMEPLRDVSVLAVVLVILYVTRLGEGKSYVAYPVE